MKNNLLSIQSVLYSFLFSVLIALLGGIFSGYFNYILVKNIGISLQAVFFFGTSYYIGKSTRKVIPGRHIVYTLIALFFIIVSYIIMDTILVLVYSGYSMMDTSVFFRPIIYLQSFWLWLNPVTGMSMGVLNYLLSLLIFIVGTYIGIQQTLIH